MRYVLGLAFGAFAIGFAAIWVRLSLIGPLGTGLWRMALATLMVFIWGALTDRESLKNVFSLENRKWLKLTLIAGLSFGADLAIWHISIHKTSVALATLFANFAPIFMLIGSVFFLGEKIQKKALLGIGFCILGIICLAQKKSGQFTSATWFGNSLALLAACFYAGYLLLLRKVRVVGVKPIFVLGVLSFSGMLLLLVATVVFEPKSFLPTGVHSWIILFSLALTAQVLGQGLIAACLSRVSNDLASALLCLQSVFAAVGGYFIVHESLTFYQILGGILIICGIFVVRIKERPSLRSGPSGST